MTVIVLRQRLGCILQRLRNKGCILPGSHIVGLWQTFSFLPDQRLPMPLPPPPKKRASTLSIDDIPLSVSPKTAEPSENTSASATSKRRKRAAAPQDPVIGNHAGQTVIASVAPAASPAYQKLHKNRPLQPHVAPSRYPWLPKTPKRANKQDRLQPMPASCLCLTPTC